MKKSRIKVVWIRFKLLFKTKEAYGISYKGTVYLNKKAIKAFERSS